MARLREIPRTATFAWSPGSAPPSLATGTKAGAVDADFSNDTTLELWDLGLDNTKQGSELQPVGSISTDSRFHDIAWSQPAGDRSAGVIAGALENGSLDLWDAEKLRTSPADSFMSRTSKHSGAIKALQFNHFRNELLATAGAKGELYISDLNNISNPFRLGASAARADDFECLDWNKGDKVPHILATGSSGGFVTVWDVRGKKENLTLNNMGRKAVSAVSWDPQVATRLITAIPNDQDPLILVWDLRNSNAPERTLRGHDLGVLSLDWCRQDPDLLLSCGKDNRTICWNPHSGQALGDFSVVTNWTFQTRWNPHNPDIFATASFDGKISIQTTQNTNPQAQQDQSTATQAGDEDFFAQSQARPQGPAFSLPTAPNWRKRPAGVSFGFGGKLVRFNSDAVTKKSKVTIDKFAADSAIPEAAQKFDEAIKGGDLAAICEKKISETTNEEEKADWQVIETLNAGKSRKKLREYLGFGDEVQDITKKMDDTSINGDAGKADTNGAKDDDFFSGSADGDNFLADLAATKGAKTNEPFQIHSDSESEADKNVTSALILGSFEKALDICLQDDRMSDAFMIAICGGQACIDKVQRAYLKKKAHGPSYLRLLASIVGKNLWDVVHNADLADWKQVMATLCTFADESEFSDLCEALGDRIEEALGEGTAKGTQRRDASFCFLAGSKLEKVVKIWAEELEEKETAGLKAAEEDESSFSVHARSLQDFVEKVTVFRQVTQFHDDDKQAPADWKLAPLYAKYTEYADILASHGQLQVAERYLDLLPSKYPLADVAQQRIKKAMAKAGAQPAAAARLPATAARTGARSVAPGLTPAGVPLNTTPTPSAPTASPYAHAGMSAAAPPAPNPFANTGYTPAGYQQSGQPSGYGAPGPYGGGYQQAQQPGGPPPPRMNNASPSVLPPPPKAGSGANWNDLPETFAKAPATSRRGTPGPSTVSAPFPNNPNMMSPPPSGPGAAAYGQARQAAPLPPPPKAGQSTPKIMSPTSTVPPPRPTSAAANAYAPPQTQQPSHLPNPGAPPQMRGASPYNPPPSAAATNSRYAPAAASTPSAMGPGGAQPPRNIAPPPNPYAPAAPSPYGSAPSPYGVAPRPGYGQPPMQQAPPAAAIPPLGPPPSGPPRGGPPGGPPSGPPRNQTPMTAASGPPPLKPLTPAATSKYPPGDRDHIPASAQPIFEILSADMARVKSRAPASFERQVNDTEKRLNMLFDHLNNGDLLQEDTIREMVEISRKVQSRDMSGAEESLVELQKSKGEKEGGNWMVGVKRLIAMSKATPV